MAAQKSLKLDPVTERAKGILKKYGIPDDAVRVIIFCESSHWDLNWLYTSEMYYQLRIRRIIGRVLRELLKNPRRIYSMECVFFLKMYWERNPKKRGQIRRLVNEGRIRLTGSGFTTPDTLLPQTESIIRDYLMGQEWMRQNGMVQEPRLAYLPDNFGNSPALPSILKALGFEYTAVSRIDGMYFPGSDYSPGRYPYPGSSAELLGKILRSCDFVWQAPDGSQVLCHWNPYTYGQGDMIDSLGIAKFFDINFGITFRAGWRVAREINKYADDLDLVSTSRYLLCPIGFDFNSPIPDLPGLLDRYNDKRFHKTGIFAVNAAMEDYMDLMAQYRGSLPVMEHDPNPYWMGFYFSRPQLKQMSRKLTANLVTAEKLLLHHRGEKGLDLRLNENLKEAWETAILSNHHDFITGTSSTKVWEKEQRPWLMRGAELVDGILAAVALPPASPSPRRATAAPRWGRDGSLVTVESRHYRIQLDETAGGCMVRWETGKKSKNLLTGPGNDLVAYSDSGGLWRMGHEFAGGHFKEIEKASDRPAQITVYKTGDMTAVRVECILAGRTMTRTMIFSGDATAVTMNVIGSARRYTTVTSRFHTVIQNDALVMDVPGGLALRPCLRHYNPTFWSFQRLAHAKDGASGKGLALFMDPPATVSANGAGVFEIIVTRNTPMERAFGLLPVPAHPASGPDSSTQSVSYALCFTASGGWIENRDIGTGQMMESYNEDRGPNEAVLEKNGPVRIMAAKAASRGKGIIVRLYTPVPWHDTVVLSMPDSAIRRAVLCDARERDIGNVPVRNGKASVAMPGAIATVRIIID